MWATLVIMSLHLRLALFTLAHCSPESVAHLPAELVAHFTGIRIEFTHWMGFLNLREREVMTLRFIEQWEYHEIAAAKRMPIGTVQWIVFNAKKKLSPRLRAIDHGSQRKINQPKPEQEAA